MILLRSKESEEGSDELKIICYDVTFVLCLEIIMHNLVSFNQLAYWHEFENEQKEDMNRAITDYFECLTECNDDTQTCRRICRSMFN